MEREEQYDLLTAALIGVALGAAAALLVNAAVPRDTPTRRMRKAVRRGGKVMRRGGRAALAAPEAVRHQLGEYLDSAREAIADTVESELKDLRKSIRRQRRRLGV
jgi:gas vesicle protein